jgi:hypothetical protein
MALAGLPEGWQHIGSGEIGTAQKHALTCVDAGARYWD